MAWRGGRNGAREWGPALGWSVLVFGLALVPPPYALPSDLGTGIGDMAAHGVGFGLMALLAMRIPSLTAGGRRLGLLCGTLVLLAGLLEVVQLAVGRAAQLSDWIGGALGVLLALGVYGLARRLGLWPTVETGKGVEPSRPAAYTFAFGTPAGESGKGPGAMVVEHRYVPFARIAEIPEGGGLALRVEGRKVVLFHIDGEFHAFEDFCEQGVDLSQGVVSEEGDVLCPRHGWRFDVHQGVCSMVPDCRVTRFPVKVEGQQLLIGLP